MVDRWTGSVKMHEVYGESIPLISFKQKSLFMAIISVKNIPKKFSDTSNILFRYRFSQLPAPFRDNCNYFRRIRFIQTLDNSIRLAPNWYLGAYLIFQASLTINQDLSPAVPGKSCTREILDHCTLTTVLTCFYSCSYFVLCPIRVT